MVYKTTYDLALASFLLPTSPSSSSFLLVDLRMEFWAFPEAHTLRLSYFSRPTSSATLCLSSCKTKGSFWGWGIVFAATLS